MSITKGLRSGLRQWASDSRAEAAELRTDAVRSGCCPIDEAPDREPVTVQGSLRTVTLRPRGGVPALEAELYDGSGTITILWLGRRRIAGISPGRSLEIQGRIGAQEGQRIMYNPRYELIP